MCVKYNLSSAIPIFAAEPATFTNGHTDTSPSARSTTVGQIFNAPATTYQLTLWSAKSSDSRAA